MNDHSSKSLVCTNVCLLFICVVTIVFCPSQTSLVKTAMCHFAMENYTLAYSQLELALSLSREGIHTLSDHRQVAEVLNNLGCLSYMGGEIERAMLFFREAMKILTKAVDFATYSDVQFDSHSTILALSIAKSNVAFLSLTFYRDVTESVTMFESVVKDQQLLLRDADVTVTTTMEHLAAANLLAGDQLKALQLLRRVLHMQVEAFGSTCSDEETSACERTRHKIAVLEHCVNDMTSFEDDAQRGNAFSDNARNSTTAITCSSDMIAPILETSRESSGSDGTNTNTNSNTSTGSCANNDEGDTSSSSMTNTLKAWRESNAMTEETFLINRIIL
jgi:tetratricopeptide (TPR) repeat protein